ATRTALSFRYTYLPYLYTLHALANKNGGTVFTALWMNFPMDTATYKIDAQFMWGNGLLVTPIITQVSNTAFSSTTRTGCIISNWLRADGRVVYRCRCGLGWHIVHGTAIGHVQRADHGHDPSVGPCGHDLPHAGACAHHGRSTCEQ